MPILRFVKPEYKAIVCDRMAPTFKWLDDLSMMLENEHLESPGQAIHPVAADMLAQLLTIAAVPRALHGTREAQEVHNYAKQLAFDTYKGTISMQIP